MPDVLLFGATGYTGRLTARALADRSVPFAIAGRNHERLEALAARTGGPDVRVATVGDPSGLARAAADVKVLVSCVGPFAELGDTAAEAAVRAGVHYVDSSGETEWVGRLAARYGTRADTAGVAMAPAMGFDEVPGDVAATLAAEDMHDAELWLTYALPRSASAGTVRTTLRVLAASGPWRVDGAPRTVGFGDEWRWAPLPPPLGPRRAISAPLAIARLAPMHLSLRSVRTYTTAGELARRVLRGSLPALRVLGRGAAREGLVAWFTGGRNGPGDEAGAAAKWTVLAEAEASGRFRNVVLTGTDPYGLTAALLAASAGHMAAPGYSGRGVLPPVAAIGLEPLRKELAAWGVFEEIYQPRG